MEGEPFEPPPELDACRYCGGYHAFACPYVESLEYEGTQVRKVVFRREHYRDLRKVVLYGSPRAVDDNVEP